VRADNGLFRIREFLQRIDAQAHDARQHVAHGPPPSAQSEPAVISTASDLFGGTNSNVPITKFRHALGRIVSGLSQILRRKAAMMTSASDGCGGFRRTMSRLFSPLSTDSESSPSLRARACTRLRPDASSALNTSESPPDSDEGPGGPGAGGARGAVPGLRASSCKRPDCPP
jgi:hypothetical protein